MRQRRSSFHDTLAAEGDYPTEEELLRSYRELGRLFTAEVTSFERSATPTSLMRPTRQ